MFHPPTTCLILNPSCLDPGNSQRSLLDTLTLYRKLSVTIIESRNVQYILQPFLAARHGFLLNGADSPESPEVTPEIEDGFLDTEDGSSLEEEDDRGLFEDESLVEEGDNLLETGDESLFEEEEDLLETDDEESFLKEEGDGLLARDDVLIEEEEREEAEDCIDESAGFLDSTGVAGLEERLADLGGGLEELERPDDVLWTEGIDPVRLFFDVPSSWTESLLVDIEESCCCGFCAVGRP
jgi:hypothetical protein